MALLKNLKEFNSGTTSEMYIKNYILNNLDTIENLTARDLGKSTFTSASSIVRFCNKLGYKGYSDFKMKLLIELKNNSKDDSNYNMTIEEKENTVSLIKKITEIQKKAILETSKELSFEKMNKIKKWIHDAETIDFYAYDLNINLAHYASTQLLYARKKSTVHDATNMRTLNALLSNEKNLAIIISQTGENSRLIELIKILKDNNTKIIVITSSEKSTIADLSDECLYAATSKSIRSFLTPTFYSSVKYILDILWALEFSSDLSKNLSLNKKYDYKGEAHFWGLIKKIDLSY